MIVSHKHKFIFIKTRKTAGTSVEIALSSICGRQDIITPITKEDEALRSQFGFTGSQNFLMPKHFHSRMEWYARGLLKSRKQFYNHMPARAVRKYLGELVWNSYYKFSFERHPYNKSVSAYNYLGGHNEYGNMGAFIKQGMLRSCIDFDMYSNGGVLILDNVFKMEEINESFKLIEEKIGVKLPVSITELRTKTDSRGERAMKVEHLSDEDRKHIQRAFAREFITFNYQM